MLTNKCKQNFEKWLEIQEVAPYKQMFWDIPTSVKHTYLQNFFDQEKIIFEIQYERNTNQYWGSVTDFIKGIKVDITGNFKSREKATNSAVEKQNELYNLRNNE